MPFSAISEAIVLITVPAAFWHMLMIQTAARASAKQMVLVGGIMLTWTVFAYASIRYDADAFLFEDLPFGPVIYLAAAVGIAWYFRSTLLGHGVPQQLLIGLQMLRPVGMIYILESERGTLPGTFAHPAGWGDLVVGLVALGVLIRHPSGAIPPRAVILVAAVGLVAFASAFFFGFTTSATPLQLFEFAHPNRVMDYPLGLIAIFLVPYAIIAHLLSLAQLARDRRHKDQPAWTG